MTVVDLTVSLLGVLAVLPAALVLAERRARVGERPGRRPGRARVSEPGPFGVGAGDATQARAAAAASAAAAGWPRQDRDVAGSACSSIVVLAYITLNTRVTDAPGSRGVPVGRPLPRFAAPLALSRPRRATPSVGRDARPARVRGPRRRTTSARAGRARAGRARVLRAALGGRCERQIDALDAARARRFPDVRVRGGRDPRRPRRALRTAIRKRGWRLPVAYDHDGAVANAYAVAVCPTITFARQRREGRARRRSGTCASELDGTCERWPAPRRRPTPEAVA